MSSFEIKERFAEINRLRFIFGEIFKAGGNIFLKKIGLKYLVPFKCRLHCLLHPVHKEHCIIKMRGEKQNVNPEVLRKLLEKLGPTFVKFGQVLSLRSDLIGEELSKELSKLQSNAPKFPYEEAVKIIQEELGSHPNKIFKSFDKESIAAASLSQVYKAVLKDGTRTAVKVQRPDIERVINLDIKILLHIANLIEKNYPELKSYHPVRVVKEFSDWTLRELNFELEGHNAERFSYAYKDNHKIHVPRIYWDYTSKRVLTMEFLEGIKADDLEGMKRLKTDRQKLASSAVEAMLQQFLIDGFFHADPHPGNFFVMKNNVLCLHDFGMVGYLDEKQRKELVSCFIAFENKDIDGFLKHFLHLADINEKSDVSGFEKDVSEILSQLFYSKHQASLAIVFFKAINKGASRDISFSSDLVLFGKAIMTAEAMGLKIYPGFEFNKEFQPFIKKVWIAYLNPKKIFNKFKTDFFDYQDFIKELPIKAQSVLEKIENREIGVKVDTADLVGIKTEFDRQNDVRILGMTLTAVFLSIIASYYLEGQKFLLGLPLNKMLWIVFGVLFLWLLFKLKGGAK